MVGGNPCTDDNMAGLRAIQWETYQHTLHGAIWSLTQRAIDENVFQALDNAINDTFATTRWKFPNLVHTDDGGYSRMRRRACQY